MNRIIKDQLSKCKVAEIPDFDENSGLILINKKDENTISKYKEHRYYILELSDYMLNPPADFAIKSNWNRGIDPKSKYYKAEILQVMGKMVKIHGCGYDYNRDIDLNDVWEGWVPQQYLNLISELK